MKLEVLRGPRSFVSQASMVKKAVWIAYYSDDILSNGKEPFDQTSSTAFMPYRFEEFDSKRSSNGTVMISKTLHDHMRLRGKNGTYNEFQVIDTGFALGVYSPLFRAVGVPEDVCDWLHPRLSALVQAMSLVKNA